MASALQPGEQIEVFYRMPYGLDNGMERLDGPHSRWLLALSPVQGTLRPRMGWTERWLPATVLSVDLGADGQSLVRFRWDVRLWYDWASGEAGDNGDPTTLIDIAPGSSVRPRSPHWTLAPRRSVPLPASVVGLPACSEAVSGGVPVKVSFIVFRWGAARFPCQYDQHSWGAAEGSTVSGRFVQLFFRQGVTPRLGQNYEVLTVFIQSSDEFKGISDAYLLSLCRGEHVCALYFLWPTQRQQSYGEKWISSAAYVEEGPFFEMVGRLEAVGIPTRWPHHSQLWRSLACKDWVNTLAAVPKYHVPLTTRVPKSLIIVDPARGASLALAALWQLQAQRKADDAYVGPSNSDWMLGQAERCVAKLGFSYEGMDVKMVTGQNELAHALHKLATQPGHLHDCVHVQQKVHRVDLEARCFVMEGRAVGILWTRFGKIDERGYVRDYQKAKTAEEAMDKWFNSDQAAWQSAMEQISMLSQRWWTWLLTQSAEPPVSLRIDYMLERVSPGRADVWTGELGEQGYSMGGIDPAVVFKAVVDTIAPELKGYVHGHDQKAGNVFQQRGQQAVIPIVVKPPFLPIVVKPPSENPSKRLRFAGI